MIVPLPIWQNSALEWIQLHSVVFALVLCINESRQRGRYLLDWYFSLKSGPAQWLDLTLLPKLEKLRFKSVTNGEKKIYTTICKRDASGNLLYDSGSAKWCSEAPRGVGWGGWWEGNSRGRGHMYTYNKLMLMYSKNHHNIVKSLSSN